MNVLLVSYSFPPAGGVGVLRALSLAKYLPESGMHVEVLTARNAAAVGRDTSLLRQLPDEVIVHRTWTPDLPFVLRKQLKKLVSGKQSREAASESDTTKSNAGLLKRVVGNLLLPDPQVGWIPFAQHAAARLIRKRQIDVVLVTVPPFSSVLLVSRLRKMFPHLPIVLDFRDEWLTTTIDLVSFNNNLRARAVAQKAEADAVNNATLVVCVTHAAVRELRKRYPALPPAKFQCVPNGFDTTLETSAASSTLPSDPIVLTYLGTVYGSTDPAPLVEAVLKLPAETRDKLKLRFIGHIETEFLRQSLLRLESSVELIPFLPHAEALEYIKRTTYLLLITHDPINVSAKLYDYIGSGKPILAAVCPGGDAKLILDATRSGWSADVDDVDALSRLLTAAVARVPHLASEFLPDSQKIAAYHRRPLTARYAELLQTIAGQEKERG